MKSLIIGAQGLVGSALSKKLPEAIRGIQVEPSKPNEFLTDVTKYETLFTCFSRHRPDIVYLPAAIAHVDKCEDAGTNLVNVRGALNVLRLCEQFGSKLVYFSSSYVFDGESKTPYSTIAQTNPIQNYGRQKETIEKLILKSSTTYLIVRTVGVFGEERRKKNFAKQVISAIFAGKSVYAPIDQFMNPILSVHLAEMTIKLAENKVQGVYHIAGDECLSKFDFAKRVAKPFLLDSKVVGVTSEEMKQKAKRPKMGALDCTGLRNLNETIPSFEGGLSRFLQLEYGV